MDTSNWTFLNGLLFNSLAVDTDDWSILDSLNVMLTGLVVVFIALIILIVIVSLIGRSFARANAQKKAQPAEESAPAVAAPAAPAAGVSAAADSVEEEEVVAAITAAIACMMTENGVTRPFRVKSIRSAGPARNAWNMAGLLENTRPF